MRQTGMKFLLVVLALFLISQFVDAQKKVLMIAREVNDRSEYEINNEANAMINLLQNAGFEVTVASELGKEIVAGLAHLKVDMKLSEAKTEDYLGVIVPCMHVDDSNVPADGVRILKEAAAQGKPIAAQHAWEMIAPAGLISFGRRMADSPGVVVDGKLVTSFNCPTRARINGKSDDTYGLVKQFIKMLNAE
jgi:putative intracellular protease/amidase